MGSRSRVTTEKAVNAGYKILVKEGEAALGFNRVARELGIKPPSLYNHVENDADLKRRIADRCRLAFREILEDVPRDTNPRRELAELCHRYRRFGREYGEVFRFLGRSEQRTDHYMAERFFEPMIRLGVPETVCLHAWRTWQSALDGFIEAELRGNVDDVDASFEFMVRTITRGLKHMI